MSFWRGFCIQLLLDSCWTSRSTIQDKHSRVLCLALSPHLHWMGIETLSSDVEESTEPPICACTTRHPPQLTTAASTVKPESYSEQANISAAPCRPHSLSAASDGASAVPDSLHKYAHTLDAAELADLLQVDIQYVLVVSSSLRWHCVLTFFK